MSALEYDRRFDPPMPVAHFRLRLVTSQQWIQLAGLIDTGADLTLIPADVASDELPVAGVVRVGGVTGVLEDVLLYRAEVGFGGDVWTTVVAGLGSETIIGRDVLNRFVMTLDGPAGTLSLPR